MRQIRQTLPIATLCLLALAAGVAMAQGSGPATADQIEIDIPFDFVVDTTPMKAGAYVLATGTADDTVWTIRRADGDKAISLTMQPAAADEPHDRTEVLFTRTRGTYVLTGLRIGGGTDAFRTSSSSIYDTAGNAVIAIRLK